MKLHKMIEICLKDDNMHIFVMINALICINNYVITCINSMLSVTSLRGGMHTTTTIVLEMVFCDGPSLCTKGRVQQSNHCIEKNYCQK